MKILIAALAENGVIGNKGDLIWRLPDDLKRFKQLTMGKPMLMGRKTFDSFKSPLKGRKHLVVSRNPQQDTENVKWFSDLNKALNYKKSDIYIIGGGKIYAQTIKEADRLELTRVHHDFDGDTFFPEWDEQNWNLVKSTIHPKDLEHKYAFTYETWERKI